MKINMKKGFAVSVLAVALAATASAAAGKDFKVMLNLEAPPIARVSQRLPGFGYVDDPKVGGEDTVLDYRHSGAWILKTKKCDDESLAFLKKYGIHVLLVLDGDRETIVGNLMRIHEKGFGGVIAGFQLGDAVDGGGEGGTVKWRAVAAQIAKRFPKAPLGIPARDAKPPMRAMLADMMERITHLVVDLSDSPAPYQTLKEIANEITRGEDKVLKRSKMWVIAPDRLPGTPVGDRDKYETILWKFHWLMASYAVEKVDAVIFNQPAKPDTFGLTLRYFWAGFFEHPIVHIHGEAATSDHGKMWDQDRSPDLDQSFDDLTGGFGGEEHMKILPTPKACANYAANKTGEVEYLVCRGNDRVCLMMVNSGKEPVKMAVDIKGLKSGNSTYRRMTFDPETGKVTRKAIGGYSQPGYPFYAVIKPYTIQTVTFILTSQNYNKAGYGW